MVRANKSVERPRPPNPGQRAALAVLWFYRKGISAFKPPCCRFQPTCSAYARDAIITFGLVRGSWLALRRILRCHPFYRGPLVDPVPQHPNGQLSLDQKTSL